ncbi:M67 family metallopeptidase [Sphingomonas sp. Tas61C01]|uniref:M67 family metallopeptidase n=1 Tax=Sphingomonas sp. Tas61C01 TaxID=3458297 RepID=UPI00403E61E0
MVLEISSRVVAHVHAVAAASPDREVCGLLFGTDRRIDTAQACRNVAADPTRRFELDPAALLAAHRGARAGGATIVGHYHSHPLGSAKPSTCDADAAAADGAIWLIVAGGDMRAWRAVAGGALHGRFDSVTLRTS